MRPRSQTTMKYLEDGHLYHAIYYGYNAMGPHYNLVSDERWKIVYMLTNYKIHKCETTKVLSVSQYPLD